MDNKLTLSYNDICLIVGNLILSSRSETLSAEQNISALLKQVQDKNQEIQDLKQQLAFEIKINAGNQE
jgi:cell division protein FtsL